MSFHPTRLVARPKPHTRRLPRRIRSPPPVSDSPEPAPATFHIATRPLRLIVRLASAQRKPETTPAICRAHHPCRHDGDDRGTGGERRARGEGRETCALTQQSGSAEHAAGMTAATERLDISGNGQCRRIGDAGKTVGWGTRIRTWTNGVRVRSSTVKLSPTEGIGNTSKDLGFTYPAAGRAIPAANAGDIAPATGAVYPLLHSFHDSARRHRAAPARPDRRRGRMPPPTRALRPSRPARAPLDRRRFQRHQRPSARRTGRARP